MKELIDIHRKTLHELGALKSDLVRKDAEIEKLKRANVMNHPTNKN